MKFIIPLLASVMHEVWSLVKFLMSHKVKMVWKSLHPKDTRNLQPVQDQVNHSHKVLQSVEIWEENYLKHAKEIVHTSSVW